MVSGGRLVLGVGVGSLEDEFVLLGAEFEDRGPLGDDAIRALRAALSQTEPTYDGEYFTFGGFVVEPAAVQEHVPIWIGGRHRVARCAAPSSSATAGRRSGSAPPSSVRSWIGRATRKRGEPEPSRST